MDPTILIWLKNGWMILDSRSGMIIEAGFTINKENYKMISKLMMQKSKKTGNRSQITNQTIARRTGSPSKSSLPKLHRKS
jgi:hypothetical protein